MKIIPVLDLKDRQIVHARAGNRDQYLPLRSSLCKSARPLEVAHALANQFGFEEFYLADLDAIVHQRRQYEVYTALASVGYRLWLDAGFRDLKDIRPLLDVPFLSSLIVGSETLASVRALEEIYQAFGRERCVLSVDLFQGRLRTNCAEWNSVNPMEVVRQTIDLGIGRFILLDLARVGTGNGLGTEALAEVLKRDFPELEIFLGGGIRSPAQLESCERLGCDGVLVATALHNGQLQPADLKRWLN